MFKTFISHVEEYDRKIFWTISAILIFGIFLYIYFLSLSVYSVIYRKRAEAQSDILSAKVSELESSYVALDKQINLELAHREGFIDIPAPHYIDPHKNVEVTSLTLRDTNTLPH